MGELAWVERRVDGFTATFIEYTCDPWCLTAEISWGDPNGDYGPTGRWQLRAIAEMDPYESSLLATLQSVAAAKSLAESLQSAIDNHISTS